NKIIKDIGNKISINPLNNIFSNIFKNILGTNGRQDGSQSGRDIGREVEGSDKKVEEVKKEKNNSENTQKIPHKCENRFTNSGIERLGETKEFKEIYKDISGSSNSNKRALTLEEYQKEKWHSLRKRLKVMRDAGIPIAKDLIEKYRLNEILEDENV
ncbi:MAG: hypothetical protein ABIK76_03920, partial [candidate division WOR-3 bacterium]